MLNDLEDRVHALISEVKTIEGESEGIYLTMGRLFPALMAETGRSSRVAEDSLSSFGSSYVSTTGRSLEEMSSFAARASAWFRQLHGRDAAFLERINESIERLSALDGLIKGVRSDSEEMEIVSLNAMTVALKSGTAGKAFSVITDELKRLSSQTILLTENITSRGRALLDYFARLRDSLSELGSFQDDFFGKLDQTLSTSFKELQHDLVDAGNFFSNLIAEARALSTPVQRIMQEVQYQDIVRQSLQHVAISLEEAEAAARKKRVDGTPFEEEIAYVASIAALSSNLLADIVEKLDASAANFESSIEEVERNVGGIEEKRGSYGASRAPAGSSCMDRMEFSSGAARYLEFKKAVFATARRLADQVHVLDESFKGLSTLLGRFKNIVVASRIEIAKNKALGGVNTTVQGMGILTGRIEEDVSGATATTKGFIKVAMAAIAGYAEGGDSLSFGHDAGGGSEGPALDRSSLTAAGTAAGSARGIGGVLRMIEADLECLGEGQDATSRAIEGFELFTPEFLRHIAESRRALENLKALASRLRHAGTELRELEDRASKALGGRADREIHSDRLKAMIERFTIFSHKRSAADIANFAIEEGVEVGEVTLF